MLNSYGQRRRIHLHRQPRRTKKRGLVEYYSLATCFYESGKNQKKILCGIGELTPKQASQYKMFLRAMNGELNADSVVDIASVVFGDEKQYLDPLIMDALWRRLELDKVFNGDKSHGQLISTENVARILTINRLLNPSSKIRTVEWFRGTLLPAIMGIDGEAYDRNKIFRELANIHKSKERLERLFWKHSRAHKPTYDVYYFDGSTSWFEGAKCSLAEADIEKTRGFFPKVVGLMLLTDNHGFPVAWELVNGHVRDTSAVKNFVNRVSKEFGIREITYCFDRGVASEENFALISECKSKFISAIRDNQIKDVFDLEKFRKVRERLIMQCMEAKGAAEAERSARRRIVGIDGFHTSDHNIFFKDLGVIAARRHVVSFNFELFMKERQERKSRIEKALEAVYEKNIELKSAQRDRDYNATERDLLATFTKYGVREYFEYSLKPLISEGKAQSFEVECGVKQQAVRAAEITDGLLVYATDHVEHSGQNFLVSAADIVAHYKGKHVVENAFRELKSFVDLRPIYVWTEEHVKAHYDICIIACFINNWINQRLQGSEKSLRDFHRHIEKAGRVAELVAPTGLEIFKLKKISAETRDYINRFELSEILSPSLHSNHSVCH